MTLAALPRFADEDRRVNLSLDAVEGPRVKIVFTGEQLPGDVRDRLVPIAREGSTDEDLLEDSTNRIRDYLHAHGSLQQGGHFIGPLTAQINYSIGLQHSGHAIDGRIHEIHTCIG